MSLTLYSAETERFALEDILFSRTDKTGIIQGGNDSFLYAAGYSVPEIIGAPHKLIRHPMTPRCVFGTAWDAIKQDRLVGAYICNKSKDDYNYWVFAVLVPIEKGYVSIRLKPTSALLPKIKDIYTQLYEFEQANGRDWQKSQERLLAALGEMGFATYQDFMTYALSEEMRSRDEKLGRRTTRDLSSLENIMEAIHKVEADANDVSKLFDKTVLIPYNMRLEASRLEGSDGPISVISSNHQKMSEQLAQAVKDFHKSAALGSDPIRDGVFVTVASDLISEMRSRLQRETEAAGRRKGADVPILMMLEDKFATQTRRAVVEIAERAEFFANQCKAMRRMLSGLELTRIMCKIERSKSKGETEGLDEIVNRLLTSEQELTRVMKKIEDSVETILTSSQTLLRKKTAA